MPKFLVTLQAGKEGSTHQVLAVLTAEQSAKLGSKRTVNVTGTLNGAPFQNSFLPAKGGRHYLVVSNQLQRAANVSLGDRVTIDVEIELKPRAIVVPSDVQAALESAPQAFAYWESLPPSHQREYLGHILDAKKPETRTRRIAQMLEKLAKG